MIRMQSVHKSYGARVLFENLAWRIGRGDRIGLIGSNGAGKTTLLNVIAGLEPIDGGEISRRNGLTIGYLRQESHETDTDTRLLDEVVSGREDLQRLGAEIDRLTEKVRSAVTSSEMVNLSEQLAIAQERFGEIGGYRLTADAKAILKGMGFADDDFFRDLRSFSGGWRTRAHLCKLLLKSPDLLLLDEPTNHLDLPSTVWLEGFLSGYAGSLVIISHDRYFLNRMVTSIAELEDGRLTVYPYVYDQYIVEKQKRREALEKKAALNRKEIEKQERFIERFRAKATKASQAQSRVKALEKMERTEAPAPPQKSIGFRFREAGRIGRNVVELIDVTQGYGGVIVYSGLSFTLLRGDRVALVGPNGAGKSSLMKIIAGKVPIQSGSRVIGPNVEIRYFAQHQADELDPEKTILEEVTGSIPNDSIPMARTVLGAFLFHGDDVLKPVKTLSGGEKSRVALAKIALVPTNFLLLDEPTNHLDIKSRQALEEALKGYNGCVLMISHDRAFIDTVANKVVHVEDGSLREYHGNYAYYERKRAADEKTGREETAAARADGRPSKRDLRREAALKREVLNGRIGPMAKRLEEVEREIGELEKTITGLEKKLTDPAVYSSQDKARVVGLELASAKSRNEALMKEWVEVSEKIDSIRSEIMT